MQPKISMIFREKCKRVRQDNIPAYHSDMSVYWQDNAYSLKLVNSTLEVSVMGLD